MGNAKPSCTSSTRSRSTAFPQASFIQCSLLSGRSWRNEADGMRSALEFLACGVSYEGLQLLPHAVQRRAEQVAIDIGRGTEASMPKDRLHGLHRHAGRE